MVIPTSTALSGENLALEIAMWPYPDDLKRSKILEDKGFKTLKAKEASQFDIIFYVIKKPRIQWKIFKEQTILDFFFLFKYRELILLKTREDSHLKHWSFQCLPLKITWILHHLSWSVPIGLHFMKRVWRKKTVLCGVQAWRFWERVQWGTPCPLTKAKLHSHKLSL